MADTVLERIVADVREALAPIKAQLPMAELRERISQFGRPKSLALALRPPDGNGAVRLIAEVKKASPSKGILRADLDPVAQAKIYARHGAAAISVLTEEKHFLGSLDDLLAVRRSLGDGRPPLLRKDFLFDSYQVYQARAYGADALLLIVSVLEQPLLVDLLALAGDLDLSVLVEAHDEGEIERALAAGAEVIGINNRDLRDFHTTLDTSARLAPLIPKDKVVVSESGIHGRAEVERLRDMGIHAVLIGEALVIAPDPAAKMRELLGS